MRHTVTNVVTRPRVTEDISDPLHDSGRSYSEQKLELHYDCNTATFTWSKHRSQFHGHVATSFQFQVCRILCLGYIYPLKWEMMSMFEEDIFWKWYSVIHSMPPNWDNDLELRSCSVFPRVSRTERLKSFSRFIFKNSFNNTFKRGLLYKIFRYIDI